MNDLAAWLAGALGIGLALMWLLGIIAVTGLIAFALRRRAYRRGTHPLRLLPWYLGGPPEVPEVFPPDGRASRRQRPRHR